MNAETIRQYCLSLSDVTESFPFGESALVFKTANKIFLLLNLDSIPLQFNVKCNPERALHLREMYPCVIPGYHMNKKHWNTIIVDGTLDSTLLKELIQHSYDLIAPKRTPKIIK